MKSKLLVSFLSITIFTLGSSMYDHPKDRGEVGTYNNKYIWTGTGQAFVPNYMMIDILSSDLSKITEKNIDDFIQEFIGEHGFTGVHIPVSGQWFHIGNNTVTKNDTIPDIKTFEKLAMIIKKVYDAHGATHIWLWGDAQRDQTAKSTKGGIMGHQEKLVLDMIGNKLGPVKGWTMGYGFDLWEWVNEQQLNEWHNYMWSKPGWNHLMGARGARSSKTELNQISEDMDYSGYEYHKPSYDELTTMIRKRPSKPSFSEDRYRVRHPSPYPDKDYTDDETRRGLWQHTMAGGIASIWGNLDGNGVYSNKEALKCFSIFWNDKDRFKKDMITDNINNNTNGYCLRESTRYYVFYKENVNQLKYSFAGKGKKVVAVDARKTYTEIDLGMKKAGDYIFNAPYVSDWSIAVE